MAEEKKKDPRTVQLQNVRLSFTDGLVEKKKATEDAKARYSCNVILDSTKPEYEANKAKVIAAMKEAGEQAFGNPEAYKSIAEDNPKRVAFRKGERFKNADSGEVYKGYEGNWAISAAAGPNAGDKRCKIFDRYRREVEQKDIEDVCYNGSYADVIVSFYGGTEGGRGVFCSIDAIRSRQEGERLGAAGYNATADDFAELPGEPDAFEGTSSGGSSSGGSSSDSDFG